MSEARCRCPPATRECRIIMEATHVQAFQFDSELPTVRVVVLGIVRWPAANQTRDRLMALTQYGTEGQSEQTLRDGAVRVGGAGCP